MQGYWWAAFAGVVGSVTIDVYEISSYLRQNDGNFPPECKQSTYWIKRIVYVLLASLLPYLYQIDKPYVAFQLGISVPLILKQLSMAKYQR